MPIEQHTLDVSEDIKYYKANELAREIIKEETTIASFLKWLEDGVDKATNDLVVYRDTTIYVSLAGLKRFITSLKNVKPNTDVTTIEHFIATMDWSDNTKVEAEAEPVTLKETPKRIPPLPEGEPGALDAITFVWEGVERVIHKDTNGLYNMSEVHKAGGFAAGKKPAQWARSKVAQKLISYLEERCADLHTASASTVYNVKVGEAGGSWCNEIVLNEYLMWLSIEYKVAVHEAILQHVSEKQGPNPGALINMSKGDLFRLCGKLSDEATEKAKQLEENKPYTEAGKQLADISSMNGVQSIAAVYGLKGAELNYILLGQHVVRRSEGGYIFTTRYVDENLGAVVRRPYGNTNPSIRPYCWFTGLGQVFINKLLAKIADIDGDSADMKHLNKNDLIKEAINVGRRKKEGYEASHGKLLQPSNLDLRFGDVVRVPSDLKRGNDLHRSFDALVQEVHAAEGTLLVSTMTEGINPEDQLTFTVQADTVLLVRRG